MGNGRDLQVEFSMHIHTTFQVNLEKLRETITPGTQPRGQDRVPADRGQPDSGDLRSRPWSAGARDNHIREAKPMGLGAWGDCFLIPQ